MVRRRPLHLYLERERKTLRNTKDKLVFFLPKSFDRYILKMKMGSSQRMGGSKRRVSSKGLGAVLKEQRAKLYIIRRCVVMLLCWHD
ncbi:hypothetical protein CARUB_v10012257mg [Capsella rubella]|uniref:ROTUNDIFOLIA like 8 n=1 Tax=Capsella rubella TaxID=81985 RepID=R0IIJ4_9BRAS|nr:hypothetical protein CARUB_v10012257mg [Capsella rubella]